jgi:hypothetical protein
MELRLFTPEQANALRPYLEAKTKRVRSIKQELDAAMARMEVLSVITDSGASPDNPDFREHEGAQDQARRLAREIQQEVESIQSRGCVVKDLDNGLIDFYSLHGDRLVFLCWKSGEEEVAYWHSLTGGYASRRPIEAHDEA